MEQPVRATCVEVSTSRSPRGRWWFVFAGLWLALALRWVPFETLSVQLDFGYFLPLLMGWMAHRYRRAAVAPLLILGIPAFIRVDVTVIEWLLLILRFTTDQYLIGLVVACAVGIPDIGRSLAQIWRCGLVWLLLAVLVFESVLRLYWTPDFAGSGRVRVDMGLLLVVFIVLASLRWKVVCEPWLLHVRGRTRPNWCFASAVVLVALALIMMVVNYYSPRVDTVRFRTGIAYASSWSFALCFALTAFGLAEVRRVCLALALIFVLSVLCAWYWPLLGELRTYPQNLTLLFAERGWSALTYFFDIQIVIDAVCAALLGAIFTPYLRSKRPDALRAPMTLRRLGLIMTAQFVLLPVLSGGSFYADTLVMAAVAFVGGALWCDRALLAVPALILVCHFAASAMGNGDLRSAMSDLLRLGFVLFPFVLAGVLSHPYITLVAPVSSPESEPSAGEQGARP